jgi:sodium transport system permease protein
MRWSIIRLIWLRDLRDQLRDRRTVVMIALLPLVLYPILGVAVMQFALGLVETPSRIGIIGPGPNFPPRREPPGPLQGVPAAASWTITPPVPGIPGLPVDRLIGAAALDLAGRDRPRQYPLLVADGRILPLYFAVPPGVDSSLPAAGPSLFPVVFLSEADAQTALDDKSVDALVSAPAEFWSMLAYNLRPALRVRVRPDDDRSRQAALRLEIVLARWSAVLKTIRLERRGLPANFDAPIAVEKDEPAQAVARRGFFDRLLKIFPFMLVMWALAGALYPAVDLCAGEKERGTMETLLISPASREEIVLGKFLTIWLFSAGTSLLNLLSMGLTAWLFNRQLAGEALRPMGLFWCVVLLVPLSAFFSAVALAVGAYARSSKEGQYYLMPLFLVTMPLVFLTLAPGVELNPFYSMVPVTGVALLMQRLMGPAAIEPGTWLYFVPVLVPVVLYSYLALRWAIAQFKREEVLFREAERLDIGLWLRRLLREKEPLPSLGQALFCFVLILAMRWVSLGMGADLPALAPTAIVLVAFVAAPAVLMALLLTTQPRRGLGLNPASVHALVTALVLAAVVLIPLVQLTLQIYERLSIVKEMVEKHEALAQVLEELYQGGPTAAWAILALVVLPALCEEIAFRGFILTGLRKRFKPWNAIWLSSGMFALYHMNVFQFFPTFILGAILGLLAIRSGSIWPGVLFHLLHNGLLVGSVWLPRLAAGWELSAQAVLAVRLTVTGLCTLLAALLLWRLARSTPLPVLEISRDHGSVPRPDGAAAAAKRMEDPM